MDVSADHKNRVKSELKAAGVSGYGLLKMDARHLPGVILPDEHIQAVAYGIRNGFSGMLIATDSRIVYTERKPFYKVLDEIAYPMISGVKYVLRGPRASVTLHTRIGDYTLNFVNKKVAEKFVNYIDKTRLRLKND